MSNEVLTIGNLVGAVMQPIYFALFLIFTKKIKDKRLLFISIMILEHFILKYACKLHYTINFELSYSVMTYLILKIVYKNKARITDMVTFIISVLFMGVINVSAGIIIGMNVYGLIFTNIFPIIAICLLRHRLNEIDKFYNKFWNRHNNPKMLKSITIRGISSVMTIITFVLMNLWLIYGILIVRR